MALELYLKDVLGLQQFLLPRESQTENKTLKVIFLIEKTLSPEAQALFDKMSEAMKLAPQDFALRRGPYKADWKTQTVVSFSEQFKPQKNQAVFWLETLSPEILIREPHLKKKSWQDLQKVMQYFK